MVRGVIWSLGLSLLLSVGTAKAQGEVFPVFKGRNLVGESVSTESFRGKEWLIVVGFDRSQSESMREWGVRFREAFPEGSGPDYYQIAAMPGNISFMRGLIQKKMASAAPEQARRHIMAVYAADSIAKHLKIESRKTIHVFVLDRDGRITHRDTGAVDDESLEQVKREIRKLSAARVTENR